MGAPKAVLDLGGRPLGARAVDALAGGGAEECVAVGGEGEWAAALGVRHLPDDLAGAGPLAAIATALGWAGRSGAEVLVIAACDHPAIAASHVEALLAALGSSPSAHVAVATEASGRRHPFPGAWRVDARGAVEDLVAAGERRASAAWVEPSIGVVLGAEALVDLDDPEDLAAWRRGEGPPGP
jgi:molybdopterin-guanine dinucleotide biosynthesis protein A